MRQLLSPRQLALLAPAALLVLGVVVAAALDAWGVAVVLLALLQAATIVLLLVVRGAVTTAARRQQQAAKTAAAALAEVEQRLGARVDAVGRTTRTSLDRLHEAVTSDERQDLLRGVVDLLGADRLDAAERHEELLAAIASLRAGTPPREGT